MVLPHFFYILILFVENVSFKITFHIKFVSSRNINILPFIGWNLLNWCLLVHIAQIGAYAQMPSKGYRTTKLNFDDS